MTKNGQTTPRQTKRMRQPKKPHLRRRAYKFRIYPTRKQIGTLEWTLRRCKEVYNAAVRRFGDY